MAKTGVTHTDTASGKGGGKLTQDPVDLNRDENAKSQDHLDPSRKGGQDPEEVAERMGSIGREMPRDKGTA